MGCVAARVCSCFHEGFNGSMDARALFGCRLGDLLAGLVDFGEVCLVVDVRCVLDATLAAVEADPATAANLNLLKAIGR